MKAEAWSPAEEATGKVREIKEEKKKKEKSEMR